NASLTDGQDVSSTTLPASTVFETYEEENDSASTTNDIAPGEVGEWDWVIQNNGAAGGTQYCFRMVESDGSTFSAYTNYPQLITDQAPVVATLEDLFENEKTSDQTPTFTFLSSDPEGADLEYEIEVDDDPAFGSPSVDANSIS